MRVGAVVLAVVTAVASVVVVPSPASAASASAALNAVDWNQPFPSCDGTPQSDVSAGTVTVTETASGIDVTVLMTNGGVSTGAVYSIRVWEAAPARVSPECGDTTIATWNEGTDGQGEVTVPMELPFVTGLPDGETTTLGDDQGTESLVVMLFVHGSDDSGPRFLSGPIPLPGHEQAPNEPPVAAVTVSGALQGGSPLRVGFDASGSYDPEGGRLWFRWLFGDEEGSGEQPYTNRATIGHTYRKPGHYAPSLQVRDDHGNITLWSGPTINIVDRYTVTVRAWIPQDEIVDPEHQFDGEAVNLRQYCPNRPFRQAYLTSRFAGDNHQSYAGSVRGQIAMVVDWDGRTLTRVGDPAVKAPPTHRIARYTDLDEKAITCTQTGTAVPTVGATLTANDALRISLATKNPLTPQILTPPIDAILTARFGGTDLNVTYTTDLFPSYGFEVRKNNLILGQHLTHDASCVPTLGPVGAALLATRLNAVEVHSPNITHHTIDTTRRTREDSAMPCFM
ncbi:PKD domain-containing protein [Micromonospora sp. NPDC050417]|uniref:PKD domain-containing protein n=1 Tax=Micromonospora sp. NPDC050417 TaxID=3364280 RepID=UPI00379643CC